VALRSLERRAHSESGPATVRVLIADDCAATRLGVRSLLEKDEGFEVCAEADAAPSAVDEAVRERPDVCLLEVGMSGAVAAIEKIARGAPETAVVVLTGVREEGNVLASLRAGAVGYVSKSTEPQVLSAAVRAAARGEAILRRSFLTKLLAELGERERRRRFFADLQVPLTLREEEVLALLRAGLTTAEIAGQLFVSQVTVRTHICSIVKKLDVRDRAAAVRLLTAAGESTCD
jgi:DNA-binding NarL/FixJ family response regulator